jgi:mycothiol synthase
MRLETDTWVVEGETGEPIGYAFVSDEGGRLLSMGFVNPEHRERGVGSLLVDRVTRRARDMVGDGTGVLRCIVPIPDRGAAELFTTSGFMRARSLLRMDAALDADAAVEASSPHGVAIRTFERARDERAVHSALMEAFAKHYAFAEIPFEEWSATSLDRSTFDPELWFVADAGGEVAGAILGVVRLDMGWIADIGVRDAWRRRGIGEALVRRSLESFRARGFGSVGLNVDPDNETGAMRLYERLGFRNERQYEFYELDLRAARGS